MDRIAFITDLHLLEKNVEKKGVDTLQNWKAVLNDVKAKNIGKIIFGGDFGEKEALEIIFDDARDFEVELILGNHDRIKNFRKYYPKTEFKEELFYTLKIGGSDCAFFDTSSYRLNRQQQENLKKWLELAVSPVIFIHHPVLDIGTWMDREHPLKNRKDVEEIINAAGKKVHLISGHYHQYHEKSSEFISQIIAPAVSYQIPYGKNYQADTSSFGYLMLDWDDGILNYEKVDFKK